VEVIRGDLDDGAALARLVADADAVVHLAGSVRGVDRAAFDAVNVAGTRHLLAALGAAPAAHLVHVSTLAAREPELSDYAGSKRDAEVLVETAAHAASTILRPTAVYGPGDVELQPLLEGMAAGLATVPGSRANRVTLIHVDDLVAAIMAALARPGAHDGPFELCDETAGGYDWSMFAAAVEARTGRRVRLLTVPRGVLTTVGAINRFLARLTGRAPMLTPGKVRELTHPDWSCDPAPFSATFDWRPAVDLPAGLATVLPERGTRNDGTV
jgi:nucleoside-diphosphate-sugar epimerase